MLRSERSESWDFLASRVDRVVLERECREEKVLMRSWSSRVTSASVV